MARFPQNTHAPRLTVPAAGDATTYRLVPGPEHLQGAASMSPNHYYSVDHIMLRVDDGVTMIYVIASMAYHNILMQHLIRMNQARVYRLPYKENFVHLDVRGASPTAIQHLHNYCQIFSVKHWVPDRRLRKDQVHPSRSQVLGSQDGHADQSLL